MSKNSESQDQAFNLRVHKENDKIQIWLCDLVAHSTGTPQAVL